MKAYCVSVLNEFESDIVFAEGPNEAKTKALSGQCVFNTMYDEYINLRCRREKTVDGMENESPELIAYKLIKEAGWVWDDGEIDETNIDEPEFRERFYDIFKEK